MNILTYRAMLLFIAVLTCGAALAATDPIIRDGRLMEQAIRNKDISRVRILLKSDYIDPNGYSNERGQYTYYLDIATAQSTADILELLLKAKATESKKMYGCPNEMPLSLFNALIQLSIDKKVPNRKMDLLLSYKVGNLKQSLPSAKVSDCSRTNRSAIHMALNAQNGRMRIDTKILDYLIKNGADINGVDYNGWTLAHLAALGHRERGSSIITADGMQYAINKGLNINIESKTRDKLRAIDMTNLIRVPNDAQCELGRVPGQSVLEKIFLANGSAPARTDLPKCKNCVYCAYRARFNP